MNIVRSKQSPEETEMTNQLDLNSGTESDLDENTYFEIEEIPLLEKT